MPNETSDGIVSPASGDDYALVSDLGALAESVQVALNRRANAYRGTLTERQAATSEIDPGALWKDTTGDQALYVREGTGWTQIWPEPVSRRHVVGTYDEEIGYPFQVFRQLVGEDEYVSGIESFVSEYGNAGFRLTSRKNGQLVSSWFLGGEGYLSYRDYQHNSPTRAHPYATAQGVITVAAGSYSANTVFTRGISFPSGLFSSPPHVKLTPRTGFPQSTHVSISDNVSESSATINLFREGTTAQFSVTWEATQLYPNYAEDWAV